MSGKPEPTDADVRALRSELDRSRSRYRRLASRRSVRAALKISSFAAPLFRAIRRMPAPAGQGTEPVAVPAQSRTRVIYDEFDTVLESQSRQRLETHYRSLPNLGRRQVSVVMPVFDRESTIGPAVSSVLKQSHEALELIVVNDGSTDRTEAVLSEFASDPRLTVVNGSRHGAAAARNAALDLASGEVIAFLDSDNEWDPDFLKLMIATLDRDSVAIAYAGMVLVHHGDIVGYRGEEFDYDACLEANFVDLNVLVHDRSVGLDIRFDPALRRLNDWDYILKLALDHRVGYAPFVGARYSWEELPDQLTLTEPGVYRRIIQYRHAPGRPERRRLDAGAIFDQIGLRICIRTATPHEESDAWGDHHFAFGLKQALERRGHEVSITFREDPPPERQNVVISLRGLVRHRPVPHSINILWNISHPDLVEFEEIEEYDLSFVASDTWPNALAAAAGTDTHVLHQATDPSMFFPRVHVDRRGGDVVFVGNSRLADRPIVIAAAQQGLLTAVYGGRWEGTAVESLVRAEVIPNREVPELYARASAVLNDHWDSMKAFGVISNRIFDVLASGGAVVSDYLPAIPRLFGTAVGMVSAPSDLRESIDAATRRDRRELADAASWTMEHHSFDVRVDSLLEHMRAFAVADDRTYGSQVRGAGSCAICDARMPRQWSEALREGEPSRDHSATRSTVSVGLVGSTGSDPGSDAVFRRVVQPLVSEFSGPDVRLRGIDVDELDETAGIDVLVVPLGILDPAEDLALAAALQESALPVVVDADRIRLDEAAPWQATAACAVEIWVSGPDTAEVGSPARGEVVPTERGVDPRLLTTYRAPRTARSPADLGVIVATRGAAGSLSEVAREALEEIMGQGSVVLTLGPYGGPALPDMVQRIGGSESDNYPRYARQLRKAAQRSHLGLVMADVAGGDQQWIDDQVDDFLAAGVVPMFVTHATADATAGERCFTSSMEDLPQVVSRFAEDQDFAGGLVAESHVHREALLASRAAAVVGGRIAARLWRVVNPEPE